MAATTRTSHVASNDPLDRVDIVADVDLIIIRLSTTLFWLAGFEPIQDTVVVKDVATFGIG